MGTVIEISTEEKKVLEAFRKMTEAANKNEDALKGNTSEAKKLERAAKRTFNETRTPAEKLERKLGDIRAQFKGGKIDAETYRRASVRAHSNHTKAVEQNRKAMLDAKEASQSAFGPALLQGIAATAGGVVSLGAAVGLVTQSMREAYEMAAAASELQKQNAPAFAGLAELSGGSATKLKKLVRDTEEVQLAAGFKDATEASQIIFELESAGANTAKQRKFFSEFSAISEDPSAAIAGAAKVQVGFGKEETGGLDAIASKAGKASADLPTVSRDRLLSATADVSASAKSLGVSDEETLAAVAMLGAAAKSESVGGTQAKSLLTAAKRTGAADKMGKDFSISNFVRSLSSKKMNRQELITHLGSTEAADAYALLAPRVAAGDLTRFSKEIGHAGETVSGRKDVASARTLPEIEGPLSLSKAEANERALDKNAGEIRTIIDNIRSQQRSFDKQNGFDGWTGALRDWDRGNSDFWRSVAAGPTSTRALQNAIREELEDPNTKKFSDDLLLLILKKLQEVREEYNPIGRGIIDDLTRQVNSSPEFDAMRELLAQQNELLKEQNDTLKHQRPAGDNLEQHTE